VGTEFGVKAEEHTLEYWHHTVMFPFFMRKAEIAKSAKENWDSEICKELKADLGENKFYGGDEISPVDCALGYFLKHAQTAGLLENEPILKAYVERCGTRDAFKTTFPDSSCTIL